MSLVASNADISTPLFRLLWKFANNSKGYVPAVLIVMLFFKVLKYFSGGKISSFLCVCVCVCACARVCVCVYILPPWRLLPIAMCPRHTWEVWINDLLLWIFIWVLLPSSFISVSENVIFHLQRRNSSSPTNWRENDMIYWHCRKRWYTDVGYKSVTS